GVKNAGRLPVPVLAGARTSLPSIAGGIVAACTAVGTKNRAAANLSFNEGEIGNSEKFCILLSCWLGLCRDAQPSCTHSRPLWPVFLLDYAENMRRELKAGILRSATNRGTAQHNRK